MSTAEQHINDLHQGEDHLPVGNKLMQGLLIAAIAASGISMVFSVGTAVLSAPDQPAASVATAE